MNRETFQKWANVGYPLEGALIWLPLVDALRTLQTDPEGWMLRSRIGDLPVLRPFVARLEQDSGT